MKKQAWAAAMITISLWSTLAVLGVRLRHLNPFLLVGTALCVSGLVAMVRLSRWRVPFKTLLVGIAGIFGYHFLLFSAFQIAPAVEVNMLNYLWPLLIVLLSPVFLPGFPLRPAHLLGAGLGLLGSLLIVSGGQFGLDVSNLKGYLLAVGAAFIWSSYSLLTKRLAHFSTEAVGGFCLISGLLSLLFYFSAVLTGTAASTAPSGRDWIFLILLGAGPMGAAFFTWDWALKHGDPRLIGSLAYLTPLFSTLLLVTFGGGRLTWLAILAGTLIILGAIVSSAAGLTQKQDAPALK